MKTIRILYQTFSGENREEQKKRFVVNILEKGVRYFLRQSVKFSLLSNEGLRTRKVKCYCMVLHDIA